MDAPLKAKVSITLDSTVIEKIRVYARMDSRNFSQYVNYVLERYILMMENRKRKQESIK